MKSQTVTATRPQTEADAGPRINAIELLRLLRDGDTAFELSQGLDALVAAVCDTGKPGRITIALQVKPGAQGDVSRVTLDDDIALKLPKPSHSPTMFYTTEDHRLTRHNPRQLKLSQAAPDAGFPDQEN